MKPLCLQTMRRAAAAVRKDEYMGQIACKFYICPFGIFTILAGLAKAMGRSRILMLGKGLQMRQGKGSDSAASTEKKSQQ